MQKINQKLLSALRLINVDKDGDGFVCREAMDQVQAAIRAAEGMGTPVSRITIERMDLGSGSYEYRVPSPSGREAAAYYTDDKDDAVATARTMWGYGLGESCPEFVVKFRSVDYWTHPDAS